MSLEQIRLQIDKIDDEILNLVLNRLECSRIIAKIKSEKNIPIYDELREQEIFEAVKIKSADNYKYILPIFLEILNSSKAFQKDIIKNAKQN